MNISKTISTISLIALAGCTSMDIMRPAMESLEGKPVQAAFSALGFPDQEQTIAGQKVYVWMRNYSGSYTIPTTSTSTTYVGTTPINTTTYGTSTQSYNANCKIRVMADASGKIVNWDAEGNEYGCSPYAERLRPLVPKKGA